MTVSVACFIGVLYGSTAPAAPARSDTPLFLALPADWSAPSGDSGALSGSPESPTGHQLAAPSTPAGRAARHKTKRPSASSGSSSGRFSGGYRSSLQSESPGDSYTGSASDPVSRDWPVPPPVRHVGSSAPQTRRAHLMVTRTAKCESSPALTNTQLWAVFSLALPRLDRRGKTHETTSPAARRAPVPDLVRV